MPLAVADHSPVSGSLTEIVASQYTLSELPTGVVAAICTFMLTLIEALTSVVAGG